MPDFNPYFSRVGYNDPAGLELLAGQRPEHVYFNYDFFQKPQEESAEDLVDKALEDTRAPAQEPERTGGGIAEARLAYDMQQYDPQTVDFRDAGYLGTAGKAGFALSGLGLLGMPAYGAAAIGGPYGIVSNISEQAPPDARFDGIRALQRAAEAKIAVQNEMWRMQQPRPTSLAGRALSGIREAVYGNDGGYYNEKGERTESTFDRDIERERTANTPGNREDAFRDIERDVRGEMGWI